MPENLRATSLDRHAPYDAWHILDNTAAVVFVPPSEANDLYDRFRKTGLPYSHLPSDCGPDVIDFGKPSADQERFIRAVFDSWWKDADQSEKSSLWCAWRSLLVIVIWIVLQLACW